MAEDALQTAYLRMLSGQVRFDHRSSFKSWAFGVIRFTGMEEMRRRRRSAARDAGAEAAASVIDLSPGPDVTAERAERAAALRAALTALSPRQREVLQLVFYHDMTIEEAAGVMRISLGSARTHYERGKKALAKQIDHVDVR